MDKWSKGGKDKPKLGVRGGDAGLQRGGWGKREAEFRPLIQDLNGSLRAIKAWWSQEKAT